jgi:hypothetical protein
MTPLCERGAGREGWVESPRIPLRSLQNAPFCPIPASGSNFNPQNTTCIPVVKIFALTRGVHAPRPYGQLEICPIVLSCRIALGLEPRLNIKYGFNWAEKIERFSKVSLFSDYPKLMISRTSALDFIKHAGILFLNSR